MTNSYPFTARVIRLKDAPRYLGMDIKVFNTQVRPFLTEFPIGIQGVGFDRVDLDEWLSDHKWRNGRPGKSQKGGKVWLEKPLRGLLNEEVPGTSKNQSVGSALDRALERALSQKPNKS
jgi:hypothetical protein